MLDNLNHPSSQTLHQPAVDPFSVQKCDMHLHHLFSVCTTSSHWSPSPLSQATPAPDCWFTKCVKTLPTSGSERLASWASDSTPRSVHDGPSLAKVALEEVDRGNSIVKWRTKSNESTRRNVACFSNEEFEIRVGGLDSRIWGLDELTAIIISSDPLAAWRPLPLIYYPLLQISLSSSTSHFDKSDQKSNDSPNTSWGSRCLAEMKSDFLDGLGNLLGEWRHDN